LTTRYFTFFLTSWPTFTRFFLGDYSNDSFSDNFFDDPIFSPSSGSETDEDDYNIPGPSSRSTSKRPRLASGISSSDELVQEVNMQLHSKGKNKHKRDDNRPAKANPAAVAEPEAVAEPAAVAEPTAEAIPVAEADLAPEAEPPFIENEVLITLRDLSTSVWGPPIRNHLVFEENFEGGIKPEWHATLQRCNPKKYYMAFVSTQILQDIAEQTNLYATQFLLKNPSILNNARVQSWEPTTTKEIANLLGILGYMGMVRMQSIRDYWLRKWLFRNEVAGNIMSRNRFELLLKMLHFSDNSQCPEGDMLYKVQPFIDKILHNYQAIYTPGKTFCIDETMIPSKVGCYSNNIIHKRVTNTASSFQVV